MKKNYRIYYSIFAIISLLPVLYVQVTSPPLQLWNGTTFLRPIAFLLAASGIVFIKRSFKEYSLRSFLGLTQGEENRELTKTGVLSTVRHPIYTGTILIFTSYLIFSLSASALVAWLAVMLYLPFGIYLEEKKLIKEYGEQYLDYKKEIPAIIPRIKF